jgi:aryl-alcohol dehydrogenase-like predicted oxidoreductase
VTKTPPFNENVIDEWHRQMLIDAVAASCERLRVERLYGLLLHHAADLAKPGAEHLIAALQDLRSRGWVERIGVSVYDADEMALAERCFRPELVQLPFNVLDRRLAQANWLDRLRALGAEVHARSVFLQGLLLMEAESVPAFFAPIAPRLSGLRARWASQGRSPLAGCLASVLACPQIDAAIVGVNRLQELEEVIAAVASLGPEATEVVEGALIDPLYLDPRRWPAFG